MSSDDLIGVKDAAAILGVNPRTIRYRVEAGTMVPEGKLTGATGAYLFRRADVEALLSAPTPETEAS